MNAMFIMYTIIIMLIAIFIWNFVLGLIITLAVKLTFILICALIIYFLFRNMFKKRQPMKSPVILSYEQWKANVIDFCLSEGLAFCTIPNEDSDEPEVDVGRSAYEYQKQLDIKRWNESVTQ